MSIVAAAWRHLLLLARRKVGLGGDGDCKAPPLASAASPALPAKAAAAVEAEPAAWWVRLDVGEYLPPVERANPSVRRFLAAHGWAE
jgi:hypothetical protein